MRSLLALIASILLFAFVVVLVRNDRSEGVDVGQTEEKVHAKLGEEFTISFNRDGNRLFEPIKSNGALDPNELVMVRFGKTSASPVPPPYPGATRPYLEIVNEYEKPLHLRVLVRNQGRDLLNEQAADVETVPANESICVCWNFDSPVDEVVLYQFALSDQ